MLAQPQPSQATIPPPAEAAGLTSAEAERRLARYGPNRLVREDHDRSAVRRLLRPLADPMVLLLLVAGITYLALREYVDAAIIFVALVPIMLMTLVLETRAERALEHLRALTAPTARVIRDGIEQVIPAEQLVPGDLCRLQEGDIIPADGEVVEGMNIMVDESPLTGESHPLTKGSAPSDDTRLYAGTTILAGRGLAAVSATGQATRYGEIGSLLATIETPSTPLQRLITRLIRQLALVALLVCLLVGLLELLTGHGWAAAIIAAVSLAIAAIPEEFPMVYTLYLSLGAWRLARDHALVRRLTSVETLGSTTVICTDKTGTLTLGTVEVAGVAPVGSEVLTGQQPLTEPARALLEAAALASEPRPYDPLDQSILRFAEAHGIDTTALHRATLLHDYPFDPVRKHVTHVWQGPTGIRCVAKGAFEGLIEVTGSSGEDLREIRAANHRLAAQGMRVIAVASGNPANVTGVRGEDERGLRLAGLIAFSDPLRPGVRDALRRCREAGIRVILITGDHPATAHAVADSLELPHQDVQIATGADIDAADDSELATLVRRVNIFARTRPEQKYRLVTALRSGGEVVAMTGDGTNDAPALREADIGVAMGQRGTEVARAAAQLVLLDDNFATIVTAVRNGRRIFVNLQHAFAYLIAFHIPLLLTALLVPLVGLPLMLLPMHLIWLELIVHPTASLVFEADGGQDDVMRQPPRRQQDLIPRRELVRATVAGLVLTAAVFGLYAALIWLGHEAAHARASALVALIVGQMTLTLTERAYPRPINRAVFQSRTLLLVVAGVLATLFAGLYFPPAARILLLAPLGHTALLASIVVGLAATLWSQPLARSRTHHQPR